LIILDTDEGCSADLFYWFALHLLQTMRAVYLMSHDADINRRDFMKTTAITGAGLAALGGRGLMNAKATTHDDVEAIKRVGEEFYAAVNVGDLDRRMATMAPDAIIMPPDRPAIHGKEEMRRLSQDYQAKFEEKCTLAYDEIETAGNWGYVRATVTATRLSKAGGGVEKFSLKNLWIVKRQADGEWKFWRIMFNYNPPPAGT